MDGSAIENKMNIKWKIQYCETLMKKKLSVHAQYVELNSMANEGTQKS